MSLDYLQGSFIPKSARYFESNDYFLYQGETFQGYLSVQNYDDEPSGAFDVDLYISTDGIIDESDYYLGTYNANDGIPGKNSVRPKYYSFDVSPITLPSKNSNFWTDAEIYYLGTIIDPNNAIPESELENNRDLDFFYEENPNPIKIQETNLPVVSFTQKDNTLNINLSEPSKEGLTINYQNRTKKDYISKLGISDSYEYEDYYTPQYYGDRAYDSELNRLYITGGNYHDLTNYKYYDADGGHYNPYQDKYYNADDSYYDVGEKLFYDTDGNATELVDNSIEYEDISSSPKYYLPTGGYISLISGVFYDGHGGYIDKTTEKYFFQEGDNGLGFVGYDIDDLKEARGFEITGTGTLPKIATPNLDYEVVIGKNIENITDTTITIAPGETTVTIDFDFLSDSIFDPNEVIEFELLEDNLQSYVTGHFPLHRFQVVDPSTTQRDDDLVGTSSNDLIEGKAGNDTINGLAGDDSINGGLDNDILFGSAGDDLLIGGMGDDSLNGGTDSDVLRGGVGDDLLFGSVGDDTLNGGLGYDRLNGSGGKDVLIGLYGNDTLNGGDGDDILNGNAQDDILNGGMGNDTLKGGAGIDRLKGDSGADIFALEVGAGQDLIVDFEDGIDLIKIPASLSFGQLNIIDVPVYSATMIQDEVSNEVIAVLQGVEADLITEADFA